MRQLFWGSRLSHKLIITDTVLLVMATFCSPQTDCERVSYCIYRSDDGSFSEPQHDADGNEVVSVVVVLIVILIVQRGTPR